MRNSILNRHLAASTSRKVMPARCFLKISHRTTLLQSMGPGGRRRPTNWLRHAPTILAVVAIVTICTTMITMFQLYPGSDESTTPVAKNRVGNAEGKPNNILVIPPVIDAFQSTKVPAPLYVPPITVIKTEPVPIGAKVNDKGQVIPLGPKTDTQQKTEEPKQEETKVEDEKKKEEMEKMKTPSKWAREDEAFVFLLTNDKPMHLIWALEGSLRDVKSTRRRIALCTPAVPGGTKDTLRKLGMEVIDIEQPRHKNFKTEFDHWADTLAKLFIFQLQGIRQFVYLDADTMVNKNVDYLFQKDTNAKVYAMTDVIDCVNGNPHLNAGLIVARPNITLRNELFGLLEDPNFFKSRKGDQEMLDVYLERHGMRVLLPETTMSFLVRCNCLRTRSITPYSLDDLEMVHFTKWFIDPPGLLRRGAVAKHECGHRWYVRWLAVYRALETWWNMNYPNEKPNLPPL